MQKKIFTFLYPFDHCALWAVPYSMVEHYRAHFLITTKCQINWTGVNILAEIKNLTPMTLRKLKTFPRAHFQIFPILVKMKA